MAPARAVLNDLSVAQDGDFVGHQQETFLAGFILQVRRAGLKVELA